MKTRSLVVIVSIATMLCLRAAPAAGQAAAPTNSVSDVEANYTKAIEGRTADILKELSLTDPVVTGRIHDAVMAQYRALRAWHDENDAALKAARADTNRTAQIQATLKVVHERFLARLAADLTPEQVDKVKDKMTYNKVQVTYNAYCEMNPGLNAEERAHLLELLKQAREEAMDCGSSEEKSAVFNRYKGKINNYLSSRGHDQKKASQEWSEKQKAKAATNSAPPK